MQLVSGDTLSPTPDDAGARPAEAAKDGKKGQAPPTQPSPCEHRREAPCCRWGDERFCRERHMASEVQQKEEDGEFLVILGLQHNLRCL